MFGIQQRVEQKFVKLTHFTHSNLHSALNGDGAGFAKTAWARVVRVALYFTVVSQLLTSVLLFFLLRPAVYSLHQ